MGKRPKKLLDWLREAIRLKHYSIRTEQAYARCDQSLHLLPPQTP